ncbi:MAG: hypothetical protein JRE40_10460 [Deltaproteobacteria bacterium]|nr:hypothetical protein [Deltaproteobacteria bacterium]
MPNVIAGIIGALAGVGVALCFILAFGCVSELDQRKTWQDCGGIQHEVCWEEGSPLDARTCEYKYYVECINE